MEDIDFFYNQIKKEIHNSENKFLLVFDFDQTLIDTFNSVLKPLLKEINLFFNDFKEFQNRDGKFKKYLGDSGHRIHNLLTLLKINKSEFKENLKKHYLESSKPIKEIQKIAENIVRIPNIEIGVVSRNILSEEFNPEKTIKDVLTKHNLSKFKFIKRIDPKRSKKKIFTEIRKEFQKHYIISIGDEIEDFISAIESGFNFPFAISGFDSKKLFKIHNIEVTNKKNLEELILTKIYSEIISPKEIEFLESI